MNHQLPTITTCPRRRHVVLKSPICGSVSSLGPSVLVRQPIGGGEEGVTGVGGQGEEGELGVGDLGEEEVPLLRREGFGGCCNCGRRLNAGCKHEDGSVIVVPWGES